MVKSITARADTAWTLTNIASSNRFGSFCGGDSRTAGSTVSEHYMRAPVAGTASRMGFRVTANGRSTSTTVAFYKNGAAGSQSVSIAGGATGWFEDTSNTDSLAQGDDFCWRSATSTGTGSISCTVAQFVFEASSGARQIWGSHGPGSYNQSATVGYIGPNGGSSTVSEQQSQMHAPDAGVLSRLSVLSQANTLTLSTTTYRLRINGADGNGVVSIAAGATGRFEDTSNTDTVAKGDLLCISKAGTGTGSGVGTVNIVQICWAPTNGRFLMGAASALTRSVTASATEYWSPWGVHPKSATASVATSRIPFQTDCSNMRIRVLSGSFLSTAGTFRLMINGVAANQNITVPTGATGVFEDTVNQDTFAAGDDVAVEVVAGTISGTLYITELGFEIYEPQDIALTPGAGEVLFESSAPKVGIILDAGPGEVIFESTAPDVDLRVSLSPGAGELLFESTAPQVLLTRGRATQMAALGVGDAVPDVRATQLAEAVIAEIIPPVEASQAAALALAEVIPPVRATTAFVLVLADAVDCVTRWQQLWRITRRDGEVLRYTSLDRDFTWKGAVYRSCRSLQPSASEDQTNIGGVGSQELRGIVDDAGISEADLEAGLYDDAFVDVWLVPWHGTDIPRRIASGWVGKVSYDDDGFEMEVTGPGARLEQQALIQVFTPSCRWVFGSVECGVDIEALKLTGEVDRSKSRDRFFANLANDSSGGSTGQSVSGVHWENGRVVWLSGRNEGQVTEVKDIDFATGEVTLWSLTGFVPQAGDAFAILPGCPKSPAACKGYGNYINFGGFPDVPGEDSIQQTPDAKY